MNMMLNHKIKKELLSVIAFAVMLCISCDVLGKVKLPSVFSDNMVFQQKTKAAVWGKADAGKTITVSTTWSRARYTSKADEFGNWKIMVATPSYGGPYAVTISDGEPLILMNVLIGEVWICSGQSNMEMPLAGWGKINNYEKEVADAKYPDIRLLQVEHVASNSALEDVKVTNNGWKPCIPQFAAEFSSVAYFFAREIYNKTKIPIGLIHTSWGGTIAEAWTSSSTLSSMSDFSAAVKKIEETANESESQYLKKLQDWNKMVMNSDQGYRQGKPVWSAKDQDVSDWKDMTIPGFWDAQLPNFDGVIWVQKKINIPENFAGKSLILNLGPIDDNDITWFNGQQVGETQGYDQPRRYQVAGNLVKAGENTITIRVFDSGGGGGLYGNKEQVYLVNPLAEKIALTGTWKYHIGLDLKDIEARPTAQKDPNRPTVLFNAMIHPFLPYAIKGVIWYQGESNADRAHQYRTLFPAMITDWRRQWGQGDFPFYFVQLANFMKAEPEPVASAWAELRDAQSGALSLPNTGMAVAINIGDATDIHPKNKQDVGKRLALIALAKNYGVKVQYTGPMYQSAKIEARTIRLSFSAAEGLKTSNGAELKGFAIAGADQKFHWAKAEIKGNQVVVSSTEVPDPVAVRYAWANNPVCNLVNGAGLPASPFRTDKWEDSSSPSK
jgi:sialate O-acetylesterase